MLCGWFQNLQLMQIIINSAKSRILSFVSNKVQLNYCSEHSHSPFEQYHNHANKL